MAAGEPAAAPAAAARPPIVEVQALSVAHGGHVVLRDIDFRIAAGEVFVILGASGSGKSSLLRDLVGLAQPHAGRVLIEGQDLHAAGDDEAQRLRRRFGVLFQAGALWSAMTVGANVMLPLEMATSMPRAARQRVARMKLALVGLDGAFDLMPAQLSGGMRKRAALARALALDPVLLFLDEPGSGLDPLNAARLDRLVLRLREHLGTTVVMVTHDIDSAFAVADRVLYLDGERQTMGALDTPAALLAHGSASVRHFMRRGRRDGDGEGDGDVDADGAGAGAGDGGGDPRDGDPRDGDARDDESGGDGHNARPTGDQAVAGASTSAAAGRVVAQTIDGGERAPVIAAASAAAADATAARAAGAVVAVRGGTR